MSRKISFEEFVKRAEFKFNNAYTYDNYHSINKKIKIKCNICKTEFEQIGSAHLNSKNGGCPCCYKSTYSSTEIFIKKARNKYNDRYSYDKTIYINSFTEVIIKCNICETEFNYIPNTHLNKNSRGGCPKCFPPSKKLTNKEFIIKSKKLYGDKYSYDNLNYINNHTDVKIICNNCNFEFNQNPKSHLRGLNGCPICGKGHKLTSIPKEILIRRFNEKHKYKYDYSNMFDCDKKGFIKINCPIHGNYYQKPSDHMLYGCKKCAGQNLNTNDVVNKFIKKFGDRYDYSKVVFVNRETEMIIICKKHGEFKQKYFNHLYSKIGCPICKLDSIKYTLDDFIIKAKKKHEVNYDYSKVKFNTLKDKIIIICKKHGEFKQTASDHLDGCGCPKCRGLYKSTNELIDQFREKHGNIYDYSLVEYKLSKNKIKIICKKHGEFEQTPSDHLNGYGCPSCGLNNSKPEKELANWIKTLGFQIITNKQYQNKDKTKRFEADITIPYKNLVIEFNGLLYHHTHGNNYQGTNKFHVDKYYHRDKTKHFNDLGYDVIHIWEHEWKSKQEIVKDIIMNRLGLSRNKKIYARKTIVKEIQYNEFKEIMESSHIQGVSSANKYYGLYSENLLVAAMSFSKTNQGDEEFELKRYVNLLGYNVVGGASKLFKFFMKENNYPSVKSFSMDRLFNGRMYEKLGFIKIKKTPPTYFYHKGYQIINRRSAQKRYIKDLIGEHKFDENKTEVEMMNEAGYFQIFDTGLTHWSYNTEI